MKTILEYLAATGIFILMVIAGLILLGLIIKYTSICLTILLVGFILAIINLLRIVLFK